MKKVTACIEELVLPTYEAPAAEDLPMFAENRVHQRSTGRPYPNKVVLQVDREHCKERAYTVVRLENEYIKVVILPQIGGRIYSATDKTTGYDFFYKQHVIKPALIGVLGSWVSGGVEFNWPFHHRASGFMPCDYQLEELEDGSAICWLSEHDPIDRMKGMVGIVLRPGAAYFETRMRLFNRTNVPHSFLWWENAAVPVNEQYQIFFPQDVTYVNFHYLKSRSTYPLTNRGVFNGITMPEGLDISMHKNTRQATSYFASASQYDFFGGYDHGKECGVVHIGDHHVSPGKKMFTWAYCQLAKSWENALTDTDGQYAELMAGSYSDNQPDFAWLEPYETKQFSQYWYPISKIGTPVFANLHCAFKLERMAADSGEGVVESENTDATVRAAESESTGATVRAAESESTGTTKKAVLRLLSTSRFEHATVQILAGENILHSWECDLDPAECISLDCGPLPEYVTIRVLCEGREIASYTEQIYDQYNMPETITDMPSAASMNSADELYLAGVHVDQYRDPAIRPDAYWKEALKRDINHVLSLIAMAEYEYNRYELNEARSYIERAIKRVTLYNNHPQSGKCYYVQGLILEALSEAEQSGHGQLRKVQPVNGRSGIEQSKQRTLQAAYDSYAKAAWAADCAGRAMTRMAMLDIRLGNPQEAIRHADTALSYGSNNMTAVAAKIIALRKTKTLENIALADTLLVDSLKMDPLNHFLRFLAGKEDFYDIMDSSAAQTCLDIADDLAAMGEHEAIVKLFADLCSKKPTEASCMVYYALGYYSKAIGMKAVMCSGQMSGSRQINGSRRLSESLQMIESRESDWYETARRTAMGATFPFRYRELLILTDVLSAGEDLRASYLLGCLYYNKLHYEQAAQLWEQAIALCKQPAVPGQQQPGNQPAQLRQQPTEPCAHSENSCHTLRNLAVAYFSHLNRPEEALTLMKQALVQAAADPEETSTEQLLYETVILMNKLRVAPEDKIVLMESHAFTRDDIQTELAKAYNQSFQPDKALEALLSHSFVPCEGGEHAIAEQYLFAYYVKGYQAYNNQDYEKALLLFRAGQELPQILGAGIWNHCKLIPNRYGEAFCLEALGKIKEAQEIYRYIADTPIDYFTNMHLKELPYYQARSLEHLGEPIEARQVITRFLRECEKIRNTKDNTYFGTTPFFISFIDDPERMREALYQYLWGLCADCMGHREAAKKAIEYSAELNNDNLYALGIARQMSIHVVCF